MVNTFLRDSPQDRNQAGSKLDELYQGKDNMGYYPVLETLIGLPSVGKVRDPIGNLRSIFKPEVEGPWDGNIGYPKDNKKGTSALDPLKMKTTIAGGPRNASPAREMSPRTWRIRGEGGAPGEGLLGAGYPEETGNVLDERDMNNGLNGVPPNYRPYDTDGMMDDFGLGTPEKSGRGGPGVVSGVGNTGATNKLTGTNFYPTNNPGNFNTGNMYPSNDAVSAPGRRYDDPSNLSTTRLMNMQLRENGGAGGRNLGGAGSTQPGLTRDGGMYSEVYNHSPGRNPYDNELNLLIRRRMSALIGKFIDAIMDEDPKIDNRTQTKLKMHAIVNRKCQNLLTSIFGGDKMKFQELLMHKVSSSKEAMSVDEAFDRYAIIKREGTENTNDKTVNDFLKGILKIDYLANHISNLIMYTTTPLEEIIRYR